MEFITYQKFNEEEEANTLAELLKQNNIECQVEENSLDFDPTFAYNSHDKDFRIKLKQSDFEAADTIQYEVLKKSLDIIDKDYYLFDFSDQELIEIITKSEEWSKLDFLLAQQILKERGKEINPSIVDTLRKQRIEELSKPEESSGVWLSAGYLFACMGGILGIFIGFHLMTHKKTLPNGDRVYGFHPGDRKHAKWILALGIVSFILWTFAKMNAPL
ncbi:MAG: hypothetical protein ACO1OQ_13125 [Rufibacter sp.]